MENRQITTPEQFANTLKELSSLLGLEFIIEGDDTYIIVNNERKKMDYFNGLFYTEEGDKVIVFNQKFTPMFLSNSCLICISPTERKQPHDLTILVFNCEPRTVVILPHLHWQS